MFPTSSRIDQLQLTLQGDLLLFLPELVLCIGIVSLLLCRLVKAFDRSHLGLFAAAVFGFALLPAVYQFAEASGSTEFFTGMLVADPFSAFVRVLLLAAALLTA